MEIIALIITNILAPIITWVLAKKRYYSEVDGTLILNMKESLEFYKKLCDDTNLRLNEVIERYNEGLEKNAKLENEVAELRKQLLNLSINICLDLSCKHRILELSPCNKYKAIPIDKVDLIEDTENK